MIPSFSLYQKERYRNIILSRCKIKSLLINYSKNFSDPYQLFFSINTTHSTVRCYRFSSSLRYLRSDSFYRTATTSSFLGNPCMGRTLLLLSQQVVGYQQVQSEALLQSSQTNCVSKLNCAYTCYVKRTHVSTWVVTRS